MICFGQRFKRDARRALCGRLLFGRPSPRRRGLLAARAAAANRWVMLERFKPFLALHFAPGFVRCFEEFCRAMEGPPRRHAPAPLRTATAIKKRRSRPRLRQRIQALQTLIEVAQRSAEKPQAAHPSIRKNLEPHMRHAPDRRELLSK